jgi:hypothetical protein
LESKLKEKNIDFTIENDVDKMLDMGIMTAPVLEVDGEILQFKDANDWINEQEIVNEN